MKLDGNTASSATLFSEQVSKVCDLFQDWNDCERSVSLFAVLKRIPFSCTKFLQSVIDTNLTQAYCLEQTKLLEHNANSSAFIQSLHEAYKSIGSNLTASSLSLTAAQPNKDSIFGESDQNIGGLCDGRRSSLPPNRRSKTGGLKCEPDRKCYERKEDILGDLLTLMPILTPGNEEAKCAYLDFIPMTVEDAIRGTVNTSLVQQIFSYLLIHPAFSTDDRRSLSKFLRHLEEHIVSTDPSFVLYPSGPSPTGDSSNCPNPSASANAIHQHSWQAIAPPTSKSTDTIISSWESQHHLTPNNGPKSSSNPTINGGATNQSQMVNNSFADDVSDFRCNNAMLDFKAQDVVGMAPKLGHLYETGPEDHHISFSKNGTEILDFDCDDTDKSNTQIGFDTLANLNEFLTVPGVIDNITLKTRRSNSLTTTGTPNITCTTSAHNLGHLMQKPRSFSLSMVSPRSSLTSSGSDTRLDDFKPNNYAKQQTQHNVGMSNIGQWLKSLRLHKYVWLFSNITYDQMLEISEEYLQNLNVTKGARHKLVVCIQRLKDRHSVMCQLEKDLMQNQVTLVCAMDELTAVVLTPMKPVEPLNKMDVGGQFLRVLNLVSTMVTSKHIMAQDEELVNSLLWILEKAVHNEAFVAHTNQLKEHRFKVSRIKAQFPAKPHFVAGAKTVQCAPSNGGPSSSGVSSAPAAIETASMTGNISRSRDATSDIVDPKYEATKQHAEQKFDSDYFSMTSSQSDSNESLDNIDKMGAHTLKNLVKNDLEALFNRKSTKLGARKMDFVNILPNHLGGFLPERRNSFGATSSGSEADTLRTFDRRDSFNGCTNDLMRQSSTSVTLNKPINIDQSKYAIDRSNVAFNNGSNLVLPSHTIPNTRFPPPNLIPMMNIPPPTPFLPVFDSTKPPPVLVHRGMSFDSPKFSFPPAKSFVEQKPVPQPNIAEKTIEYYRPKEMRALETAPKPMTLKEAALIQPKAPSVIQETRSHDSKSDNVWSTSIVPSPNMQNKVNNTYESKPHRIEVQRPNKIAANFSEQPTRLEKQDVVVKENFPSLVQHPPPQRYIVPPNSATTLAAIVRMLPSTIPTQQRITVSISKPDPTRPSFGQVAGNHVGMSNVNSWLKSLRLHKYQWLFVEMSYAQMLAVNEEYLERLNITKGARNKLVLSIQKLNDRFDTMDRIEKDLLAGTGLLAVALDELAQVVQTPMKLAQALDPRDIATKFISVLSLVFDKITRSSLVRPEDQCVSKLAWVLDSAMHCEGCSSHHGQLRKMRSRFNDKQCAR